MKMWERGYLNLAGAVVTVSRQCPNEETVRMFAEHVGNY